MPRPVVAAAIVDSLERPTELLACSRAYPQELRGQFELPGGKVEDNEDPVEALTREIMEELGTRITVGARVCPDGGLWWPILGGRVMGVWLAEVAAGSPDPRAGPRTLRQRGCPSPSWRHCRGLARTCPSSRPWPRTAVGARVARRPKQVAAVRGNERSELAAEPARVKLCRAPEGGWHSPRRFLTARTTPAPI